MNNRQIFTFLAVLVPGLAFGQAVTTYHCSFEQLQRRIEILSEPGVSVPCEVHYYKDTESPGSKQVLWTASTEAGFCAARAEEFVAKLRDWGWECNAGLADAAPTTEPMSDDTEALAPAKD